MISGYIYINIYMYIVVRRFSGVCVCIYIYIHTGIYFPYIFLRAGGLQKEKCVKKMSCNQYFEKIRAITYRLPPLHSSFHKWVL